MLIYPAAAASTIQQRRGGACVVAGRRAQRSSVSRPSSPNTIATAWPRVRVLMRLQRQLSTANSTLPQHETSISPAVTQEASRLLSNR